MTREKRSDIEIQLDELQLFVDENFSINGPEEFLPRIGSNPDDYLPIHLTAAYVPNTTGNDRIDKTNLELARRAVEKRCVYVTNIDYGYACVSAVGLKLKRWGEK